MTDAAFGRLISRSHTTVLRLKNGAIRPSLETAQAIRDATGGAVTADDFMAPRVADPAAPHAAEARP